jgi:hypothetical protein
MVLVRCCYQLLRAGSAATQLGGEWGEVCLIIDAPGGSLTS